MFTLRSSLLVLAAGAALATTTTIHAQQGAGLEPGIAAMVGSLSPDSSRTSTDWVYGVELSANCLLFQPQQGVLRHQLSVTRYSERPLKMTSGELNTHWMFDAGPDLKVGLGPGIGYVRADLHNEKNNLWAFQLGGSLRYDLDQNLFLGAEARYQWTESDRFRDGHRREDVDNFRVMAKVGVNF